MNDNILNANDILNEIKSPMGSVSSSIRRGDDDPFFIVLELFWAFGADCICMLMFEAAKFAKNRFSRAVEEETVP